MSRSPAKAHAYYIANRDKWRGYRAARRAAHNACNRAYNAAHPDVLALAAARYRAKRVGVPCTLTLADVRELRAPMRCSVTGLSLARGKGSGGVQSLSPSLDRIAPDGPYSRDNVRLVAHGFNRMRLRTPIAQDAEIARRFIAKLER